MLLGGLLPVALLSYQQLPMCHANQGSQPYLEMHIAIIGYLLASAPSNGDISELSYRISLVSF